VLHTLLHVAQWPCVPSGVTSTFAPQSSHFGLAMLSMEANNFWCQVDIVVKRLETLRRDDTIHSCNVRHHYQYEMHTTCMCASGTSKVAGGRNSSSSSFLGNRASPKNGRPQPPSPDYCSRKRCTHQTCRNGIICLGDGETAFQMSETTYKERCISCDRARMLSAGQQLTTSNATVDYTLSHLAERTRLLIMATHTGPPFLHGVDWRRTRGAVAGREVPSLASVPFLSSKSHHAFKAASRRKAACT